MSASTGMFRRFFDKALKGLGSITLGVVVMTVLAIAMGWATFLEREMGTPVAQYIVYASNWFYSLIGLLALNLLCAALVRAPKFIVKTATSDGDTTRVNYRVNRRLIPFYLAHLGILLLLAGCLTTARLSSKARATIPESCAAEKAVAVNSRLFEIEVSDLAQRKDAKPNRIGVPFAGGPLNWRDCEKPENWKANIADPLLAQKPEGKFFQDLAKGAAKISHRVAFRFAKLSRQVKPGIIYDSDGLKIELLDYATIANFVPVAPLKGEITVGGTKTAFELPFSFDTAGADPLSSSRRAQRVTLEDGTRVVYLIADSQQDFEAFQNALPERVEPAEDDEFANALVLLYVDGVRFQKSLADLTLLSRYGGADSLSETFLFQREEIARRLQQEQERADVDPEERGDAKPLQTITQDDLAAQAEELRELRAKLTSAADAATDSGASEESLGEFAQIRKEFEQKRILSHLWATWSQIESVTETSKEFCDTLLRMQAQNDKAVDDIKKLEEATKLGDSGWKIVGFETSPTILPGAQELYGLSALVQLESPEGERCETSLFSELFERNRYPSSGRVFGGLWVEQASDEDAAYGRSQNKALNKPKLELMQDLAGAVAYRVTDGSGRVKSGRLELTALDQTPDAYSSALVKLTDSQDADVVSSFIISQLAFHDEIGAKLVPGAFQKDMANEFYGQARVRVTLDDVTETFLMRAIPLESVSRDQAAFLERRIVSSKRRAVVRLTNREIDLGAALFVKKFSATYEPGSSTAASFSSLTRVLPKGLTLEEQRQAVLEHPERDVLIEMNRPGVLRPENSKKVYWAYQDSFRGPFRPGDPEFDDVVQARLILGDAVPRETIYQTIITLNDDPGRGMKYLGSLFIVWGTAMLVYRRKKNAPEKVKEQAEPSNAEPPETSARSGKASVAVLAALVGVAALVGALTQAFADETAPRQEQTKSKTADGKKLDWTSWRLLPVYDGGRRQPLNTFAEIVVRDITGSNAPTIVLPEETLARLESGKPVNMPPLEEFLREAAPSDGSEEDDANRAKMERMYKEVAAEAAKRQQDAAARLRELFPDGARKFTAAELLFSWIVEPELWEYAPFIEDPKGVVAKEVLKRTPDQIAERGSKLSPTDFDEFDADGASRVDAFLAQARGLAVKADALKALGKFEEKLAAFRSLTYVPTQSPSSRPMYYFNKILYGDAPSGMGTGSAHMVSQSALSKLDAACVSLERLLGSQTAKLRRASPFNDKDYVLRQRTPIGDDKKSGETLMLARQITALASLYRRCPLSTSGVLFEKLLASLENTLAELKTHRNEIFLEETYTVEYRQELQRVVSSLESIVNSLELAYLSVTKEQPKTLAVAPVVRASLFRATESQDSPWIPLQTLLWASDSAYARFIDPRLDKAPDALADPADLPQDKEPILPTDNFVESLRKTLANSQYDRAPAQAFLDAAEAYRDRKAPDRAAKFNAATTRFSDSMYELGRAAEEKRVELAAAEMSDEAAREEFLAKTCYEAPRGLKAELFYYDLNAYFWNWVACLLALGAFILSYLRQLVRRLTGKEPLNEHCFFTLGLVFLKLSCVVAFLGGATRAYITGWAPVANMFETVVLLAFLIAAIALGYATAPAWTKPYLNAWRATAWPWKVGDPSEKKIARAMAIPRAILIALCFAVAFRVWRSGNEDVAVVAGLLQTFRDAFAMKGALDSFAVLLTFLFVVWSVPRFLVTLAALALFPKTLFRRPDLNTPDAPKTRKEILAIVGDEIVQRKAFITASSAVALAVAAAAYFNSVEFNPHIRPLVAVLRSNFWLTIHVVAIIVSYALGAIAWAVAQKALAAYIFGRYGYSVPAERPAEPVKLKSVKGSKKRKSAEKTKEVQKAKEPVANVPATFEPRRALEVAPVVAVMIRSAVLFLTLGIILGARWADFSWGQFWSWDPKEVWALVTLLIYLVVLHAHKISGGKRFVLALGAHFGALAIIMTWYGLSFVMGGGGRHAYASGESNKIAVLYILLAANILWACLAIARYLFEKIRRRGVQ